MERLIIFGILSLPVIYISRRTLFTVKSHGFYRFFSWECILWLFVSNCLFWFNDSFAWIGLYKSFERAGFEIADRTSKNRPMVRYYNK